jgi:hypothetical protein
MARVEHDQERNASEGVNKTGQDPIVEPPNSTVDDWLGQRVARDEERAERALDESDGDVEEAEQRYEHRDERDDEPPTERPGIGDGGFGESDIPDPMPEALRRNPDQTKHVDEMGGESPTG